MVDYLNPALDLMDDSSIREMCRVAGETGAVNLAEGYPDLPVPPSVLEAARRELTDGPQRYTDTRGDRRLREQLARFTEERWASRFDPETEIVISCGASESIVAALLALLAPGDAVVLVEPFYENYLPAVRMAGARPRILRVDPFTGEWDRDALDRKLRGARAMLLNTPTNPTGKVWTREELDDLAVLLDRHDVVLIADETYAFVVEPGTTHLPPACVGGLRSRTVTVASFSKTYAVTGWRVGFAAGPEELIRAVGKVHDYLTVCAPAPLQRALVEALRLPASYYDQLRATMSRRRGILTDGLREAGWRVNRPDGTYFLLVDLTGLGIADDRDWTARLARTRGVAGIPGSAFLWGGMPGSGTGAIDRRGSFLRLSFGKHESELALAVERLRAGPI